MIFGWLNHGRTDRWVMIDPVFPWPALHHGRAVLRAWADGNNRRRAIEHSAGPRRMPWPCKTCAKEAGDVELRVWPCEIYGQPRNWTDADDVWRPAVRDLAVKMQAVVACDVKIEWLGGVIEKAPRAVKSLEDQKGFIGWARGEHEPTRLPAMVGGKVGMGGADVRVMPQGENAWL